MIRDGNVEKFYVFVFVLKRDMRNKKREVVNNGLQVIICGKMNLSNVYGILFYSNFKFSNK